MNGFLIIDKPAGWTSHDVVARVRRTLREKRVGHTGTLDPFATGVLVIMIGRATRLAQFLATDRKEYLATVRLGYATETGDLTGARLESKKIKQPTEADIEAALAPLRGEIDQVPPMYSAKKVQGRKLYDLARSGETIKRKAVRVNIFELETIKDEGHSFLQSNEENTCDFQVRVACSAGTYIRVLAESIGAHLGSGAHLIALRRTRAGKFHLGESITIEQLQEIAPDEDALRRYIILPAAALSELASLHLTDEETRRTRHGVALDLTGRAVNFSDGERISLLDQGGELIAIGVYDEQSRSAHPRICLSTES